MQQNSGDKIKSAAVLICFCDFIGTIVLALYLGSVYGRHEMNIGVVVVTFLIGSILSYLSYIFLDGYGEFVSNSCKIVEQNEKLLAHLNIKSNLPPTEDTPANT